MCLKLQLKFSQHNFDIDMTLLARHKICILKNTFAWRTVTPTRIHYPTTQNAKYFRQLKLCSFENSLYNYLSFLFTSLFLDYGQFRVVLLFFREIVSAVASLPLYYFKSTPQASVTKLVTDRICARKTSQNFTNDKKAFDHKSLFRTIYWNLTQHLLER